MRADVDGKVEEILCISSLETLEYCPRRFYYEYVLNVHVQEPRRESQQGESALKAALEQQAVLPSRSLRVNSPRWHLTGLIQVVEEAGILFPVVNKKEKVQHSLGQQLQLCAQALCLEEMLQSMVPHGYLYDVQTAQREEILFSAELRRKTERVIAKALVLLSQMESPPPLVTGVSRRKGLPIYHEKCGHCPLEPLCLPREVLMLRRVGVGR